MGIIHSIVRFLTGKNEDDDADEIRAKLYYYLPHGHGHYHPGGWKPRSGAGSGTSSSGTSFNILSLVSFFYQTGVNPLWRKLVQFISNFPRLGRAQPRILPIQNQAPSMSNDPLLSENLLISSPGNDSPESESFAVLAPTTDSAEQYEFVCENAVHVPHPEEIFSAGQQPDQIIISIPEFAYPLSLTSSVCEEETMESPVFVPEIEPDKNLHRPVAKKKRMWRRKEARQEEEVAEEATIIKRIMAVDEGRWIKHYSSHHRILLVGDGDFSFSAALAVAFGCASNMVATSLNSKEFLRKNYDNAESNIRELRSRKCKVMHEIDATKMAGHELLGQLTFDRIIYNFPWAGFFKDLSRESQLRRHRRLVSLFLKNAKEMISENGEIHITHKTNGFHLEWKLERVASSHRLRLIEAVKFNLQDYPGYNNKYGFGGDKCFNCDPSKTYKFGNKIGRG